MITIDENLFIVLIGFLLILCGAGWTLFDFVRTRNEEASLLSLFSALVGIGGIILFLIGLVMGFAEGIG